MDHYLVVGQHDWCFRVYKDSIRKLPGTWHYFRGDPDELPVKIAAINPRYVFFLHWSHFVPNDITRNYECVCFHPSHLPYGRGGTPVQNLIERGFTETKLSAFRMTDKVDEGPLYLQRDLSLHGTAQGIYERMMKIAASMIEYIVKEEPEPVPQQGEIVYFVRRTPEQSEIQKNMPVECLYDHIRMLSAEGYPHAFLEYGDYVIEFTNPLLLGDEILTEAILVNRRR